MTSLLWETALLLLGAYFLGAFTGCLIRRTFFAAAPAGRIAPEPAAAPTPPQRLPDPAPIGAAAAAVSAVQRTVEMTPAPAAAEPAAAPTASQSDSPPVEQQAPRPSEPSPASILPSAAEAPTDARPAATAPAEPEQLPVDEETAQPERPARSIGTSAAAAAALAAATARHQAAQAAMRAKAAEAEQKAPPLPAAAGTSGQASTVAPRVHAPPPAAPSPASAPAASAAPDDLTRIRAIDGALQKRLNALGVSRFADIAAWRMDDVRYISKALGFRGRIEQENWIEQAQILMSGSETAFSRRSHMGLAKPTADQGEQRPITASTSPQPADVGGVTEAVTAAATVAQPPRRTSTGLGRDNLQRISRIGEDIERLLNVQGVSRYEQIASWTTSDVARFERLLGSDGRISRENWIEQAQILARGGETAYSREFDRTHAAVPSRPRPTQLAEAIREAQAANSLTAADADGTDRPRKVDLTKLRSVRSEALIDGKPEGAVGIGPGERLAARPDDLKRIRGIGVLFEKRLNGMGYWTYEQIANWTAADVARVSKALEVKGQIERENWVEQARILASGRQTEFARRRDRGEVPVRSTGD